MRVITPDHKTPTEAFLDSTLKGNGEFDPSDYNSLFKRLEKACYLEITNGKYYAFLDAESRLRKQYRDDGVVLFLGAGVSKESGIPNWEELAKDVLKEAKYTCYCEIKEAIPSLVAQFDLAAHTLGEHMFLKVLYDCLYRKETFKELKVLLEDIPKAREANPEMNTEGQKSWSRWNEVTTKLKGNCTLAAVGDLLVHEARKRCKKEASQIHGVITVNADNLLQTYCQAQENGEEKLLTTVNRASVGDHPDTIPVYHLHGYLDARGENFMSKEKTREFMKLAPELWPNLVFRESDYYETIASPANFVNHAPQSYFQRHNVVFIGTSLDDLNIRRWLYSSFRERVQARTKYLKELYQNRYADAGYEAKLESVRHFWLRTEDGLSKKIQQGVELVMENMGVQVVWFRNFKELQEHLGALKGTIMSGER